METRRDRTLFTSLPAVAMETLTEIWRAALHIPRPIRHLLALVAPAILAIVWDRWLRRT